MFSSPLAKARFQMDRPGSISCSSSRTIHNVKWIYRDQGSPGAQGAGRRADMLVGHARLPEPGPGSEIQCIKLS